MQRAARLLLGQLSLSHLHGINDYAPAVKALGWISDNQDPTVYHGYKKVGNWYLQMSAIPRLEDGYGYDYNEMQSQLDFVVEAGRLVGFDEAARLYGSGIGLETLRAMVKDDIDGSIINSLLSQP